MHYELPHQVYRWFIHQSLSWKAYYMIIDDPPAQLKLPEINFLKDFIDDK